MAVDVQAWREAGKLTILTILGLFGLGLAYGLLT